MIYLVKYYEKKKEYAELITKFDLENYAKPNEFHQIEKIESYTALVEMLKECEVEYESIDDLLEIGKDALMILDCLKEVLKKSYESIAELKQEIAKPLIELFDSVRIRDIKDKTYITAKGSTVGAMFEILKEQDVYRIHNFNLI